MLGDRRCISCGKLAPKSEFWRVVRDISGQVTLDRGMGRSAYICPNHDCLQKAQKKNRLGRALKTAVPDSIFQTLADRLPQAPT
jgi:predicted RNA-binding protein YlxR (DUF448 family)